MTLSRPRVHLPLRHMIATRMTALDYAMGPLPLGAIRLVFNAMTDLAIQPSEPVAMTSQLVYEELLEMEAAGKLDEAIQNGLWAIRKMLALPAGLNARVLVSRYQREGGYCGKERGRHVRMSAQPWPGRAFLTLRDWRKWKN